MRTQQGRRGRFIVYGRKVFDNDEDDSDKNNNHNKCTHALSPHPQRYTQHLARDTEGLDFPG